MTFAESHLVRGLATCLSLGVALFALDVKAAGSTDDAIKQACVTAYDETQTLRQKGSLSAARARALSCSQEQCPAIVKKDCAQWLSEIDASLPTVTFAVKDVTGQDTTAARVFVDGQLLLEQLGATATPVDPGEHAIRVEIDGKPPEEQTVIVREGERGRVLKFSFAEDRGAAAPAPAPYQAESSGGGIPAASWVLGGVAVVGVGLFATFGALGLSEKGDAEDPAGGCAPNCSDDEVSSIQTKFLVADVSLGVGVAALGAAVIVALVSGEDDEVTAARPAPLAVGAAPTPNGGFASVSGSF